MESSVMSEQRSLSGPEPTPTEQPNPYVIEHYGFAASSEEREHDVRGAPASAAPPPRSKDPDRRPARARRRNRLAAGALGLVLAGGIGGVATAAMADTGPGPHRDGDRGGVLTFDVRDGDGQRPGLIGPGGRR
jgi:hypothetical protein